MESNALTYGEEDVQWKYEFRKWVQLEGSALPKEENGGRWHFFAPPRFLAKWQAAGLDQWRKTLHPAQYQRLINNIDTTGECAFVTEEQVKAIILLKGPSEAVQQRENKGEKKGYVVTGCDIGLKKDATAICSVQSLPVQKGCPPKFHLLALDVLTGSPGDPVLIREVEQLMLLHRFRYKSYPVLFDPWQAAALIQKYSGFVEEWPFTTKHVSELTQLLYRSIADKNLSIYPQAGKAMQGSYGTKEEWTLEREMVQAVIKEMSYGQRIDHQAGGYSDRIMALGMCIHYLSSEASIPRLSAPKPEGNEKDKWNGGKVIDEWNDAVKPGKAMAL